jgi:hypothetical protein
MTAATERFIISHAMMIVKDRKYVIENLLPHP